MEISKKTYELIGKLSFEYNKLGFFTSYLFDSFNISTKSGLYILTDKGLFRLIAKIRAYIKQTKFKKDDSDELNSLLDRIDNLRKERNSYIHSMISKAKPSENKKLILMLESLEEKKNIEKEIDHNQIEKLIKECTILMVLITHAIMSNEEKLNETGG